MLLKQRLLQRLPLPLCKSLPLPLPLCKSLLLLHPNSDQQKPSETMKLMIDIPRLTTVGRGFFC